MADETFLKDQIEAWARYLADTRGRPVDRYEEVEPWAWRRLTQALTAAKYRLRSRLDAGSPTAT